MSEQPQLFDFPSVLCASAQRRQGWRRPRPATENRGHHANSLDAYAEIREAGAVARRRVILDWVRRHGPATDREIRDGLFGEHADMNMVRPRVSECLRDSTLVECGRALDPHTGRHVRRVHTYAKASDYAAGL